MLHGLSLISLKGYGGIWNHFYFRCFYRNTSGFDSFGYGNEVFRSGDNLIGIAFGNYVFCASVQSRHHNGVFIALILVDDNGASALEHPCHGSGSPQAAAVMGERVTYVSCHTVTVIGIAFRDNRSAARAVSFISHFIKACAGRSTNALGNSSLDIILRYVVLSCLEQSQLQTHVTCRVGTTHTGSNCNFLGNLSCDSRTDGIIFALRAFNIFPFRMSGHYNSSFVHQGSPNRRSRMMATALLTQR